MSMPYRMVTCTNCSLQEASLILHGYFVWRDNQNREASIDRELGICRDCCTVSPIECLPNRGAFEDADEAFLAGFWRKRSLKKKIYRSIWRESLIQQALDPASGFAVLRQVMALHRGPVCLACGSAHVSTMPIPYGHDTDSEEPVPTGTIHPGCGGELLVRGSGGERVAVMIYKNVYDIHGQFVDRAVSNSLRSRYRFGARIPQVFC